MRWDPFRDFDRFFGDEDWGFVPMVRGAMSGVPVDISETEHEVMAEIALPAGIDPQKVDISVEGDVLTVRGSSEAVDEAKQKDYYRREIRRGSFERSVRLPTVVKADQAQAVYENGVLKITLPKTEESKPKKIQVQVKR